MHAKDHLGKQKLIQKDSLTFFGDTSVQQKA